MDRQETEKKTSSVGLKDDGHTPEDSPKHPDQTMFGVGGMNMLLEPPRRAVASLPPESPRPQRQQPAQNEDIEMTEPPSPRMRAMIVDGYVVGYRMPTDEKSAGTVEAPPSPRPRPATPSLPSGTMSDLPPPSPRPAPATLAVAPPPISKTALRPSPLIPGRTMTLAPLPPAGLDGHDFSLARARLEEAVRFDLDGQYNQALEAYNDAHTLYAPALNSITMSTIARQCFETTLGPHHNRVAVLEDAQVFDETEPDRFMVDPSRVVPLTIDGRDNREFRLPGPPASMVRPALIGDGPNPTTEDGVDAYLQDLAKIYGRDNRSQRSPPRPPERPGTPVPDVDQRHATYSPNADRDADISSRGRSRHRDSTESESSIESSRERAGTPLPGGPENFENRHPKRGLSSYGSVEGTVGRRRVRKCPRILYDLPNAQETGVRKHWDIKDAVQRHNDANGSLWMQDLYWSSRAQLLGPLAKDRYAELRDVRSRLKRWDFYLIEETENEQRQNTPTMDMVGGFEAQGSNATGSSIQPAPVQNLGSVRRVDRLCGMCGRSRTTNGGRLLLCARCRKTRYCSNRCQQDHFNSHLATCLTTVRRRETRGRPQCVPKAEAYEPAADQDQAMDVDNRENGNNEDNKLMRVQRRLKDLEDMFKSGELDANQYETLSKEAAREYMESQRKNLPELWSEASSSSMSSVSAPSSSTSSDDEDEDEDDDYSPSTPRSLRSTDTMPGVVAPSAEQQAASILSSMSQSPAGSQGAVNWYNSLPVRGANGNDSCELSACAPPLANEEVNYMPFGVLDLRSGSNAGGFEDEMEQLARVTRDWKEHSERQMQEDMYPKRVFDFRIQMDRGRTMEYQVSDAMKDREWVRALDLDGNAW